MSSEVATNEVARRLFSVLSQQLLEYSFKRQRSAARFIRNGGDARSERISIQLARYDDRIEIVPAFGIRFDALEDLLDAIDEDREKAETRHKTTTSKMLGQLDGKGMSKRMSWKRLSLLNTSPPVAVSRLVPSPVHGGVSDVTSCQLTLVISLQVRFMKSESKGI